MRKYLLLLLVITITACDRNQGSGEVKAYTINYRVTYLDDKAGSIPTRILPDHMTLVFANQFALNSIEGFFGQFSLSYLADLRKKRVTTLIKLFDKKYYYQGSPGEIPCGIDPMKGMFLKPADGKKTIAGYTCDEYILSRPGKNDLPVYSTREIRVKSPNITTPYREHNQVLLQFYTRLSVMDMILTADSCTAGIVKTGMFTVPGDYEPVSRTMMENVLNELFK